MIEVLKKSFTFFYGVLCLAGCIYQIRSVTDAYFNYLMTTKVSIELPTKLKPPALNVCLRYIEVFEWNRYIRASGVPRGKERHEDRAKMLTVEDIFMYTPSNKKNLLVKCIYRNRDSYNFHQEEGEACHRNFNVTNFFMQDYICYRITFNTGTSEPYSYSVPAFSLTYPNLLYSVSFDKKKFGRAEYIKVILNDIVQHPFRSASFASVLKRVTNNYTNLEARYNYFTATYFVVTNVLLPPPYATKCVRYGDSGLVDKEDCIKRCLIKLCTEKLDRYPYSILEQNKARFRIIHESDLEHNATLKKMYLRLERTCNRQCKADDCHITYAITYVTKDPQISLITFNVLIPQLPWYEVTYQPRTAFLEYFIYVLSCFGIWFGLSFLTLNPFRTRCLEMLGSVKRKSLFLRGEIKRGPFNRTRKVNFMARTKEYQENVCVYCMQSRFILMNEISEKLSHLNEMASSVSNSRME